MMVVVIILLMIVRLVMRFMVDKQLMAFLQILVVMQMVPQVG